MPDFLRTGNGEVTPVGATVRQTPPPYGPLAETRRQPPRPQVHFYSHPLPQYIFFFSSVVTQNFLFDIPVQARRALGVQSRSRAVIPKSVRDRHPVKHSAIPIPYVSLLFESERPRVFGCGCSSTCTPRQCLRMCMTTSMWPCNCFGVFFLLNNRRHRGKNCLAKTGPSHLTPIIGFSGGTKDRD